MTAAFHRTGSPAFRLLVETLLALRALLFVGRRYTCPCCGWRLRAFTHGGRSMRVRPLGYCPRCNSKARHRRIWLYLLEQTNLFTQPLRLLHVSPKYSFSRRLVSMTHLDYVGVDLHDRQNISVRLDLTATPLRSGTFDAAICVHVLEEIEKDRQAMGELYRVLRPGGWALISVPLRSDQATFEDPTVTCPKERRRVFGEEAHVRIYGHDLMNRLEGAGFRVHLDLGREVGQHTQERHGLLADEDVFYCTKA